MNYIKKNNNAANENNIPNNNTHNIHNNNNENNKGNIKSPNENTQTTNENTQTINENTQTINEKTQTTNENTQTINENTQTINENTQTTNDNTQTSNENNKSMNKNTKTILIVDDEIFISMNVEFIIKNFGYNTKVTNTGEKAINIVLNENESIDLILMDINLGAGIDGTEAAKEILKHKDIPIIFHSAYSNKETLKKVQNISRYGFVSKGLSDYILESSIEMAFMLHSSKIDLQNKTAELEKMNDEFQKTNIELKNKTIELKNKTNKIEWWHKIMEYVVYHDPSAIAILDNNLHFMYVSKRFLQDYSVKDQNIIGKHHYEAFPEIPKKWREVHKKALQGEILKSEFDFFERTDGKIDYTRWECRPWHNEDGSIGGIILYTEVITEFRILEEKHKEAQEMLLQHNEELKMINQELEQSYEEMEASNEEIRVANEELLKSDREIKLAHDILFSILENLQALVYVVDLETYKILFINEYGKKIWGDVVGKICWQTLQINQSAPCEKCSKDELINNNHKPSPMCKTEFLSSINQRWYDCSDSAMYWIDGKTVKLRIATDITERKQAENLLFHREKNLKSYIDNAPDGIFVTNNSGTYVEVNSSAARITGYSINELIGKNFNDLIFEDDLLLSEKYFNDVINSGEATGELRYIHKNGDVKYWSVKAVKLRENQFICFVSDITERKLNENKIKRQNIELKEANKDKEVLLKEIHHRVKNNMQTVQSLLNFQKNFTDSDSIKNTLEECINRIRTMMLIHENLYKSENLSKIDIIHYINNLISFINSSMNNDSITIEFFNRNNTDDRIFFEIEKAMPIGLILNELLTNAIKYAFKDKKDGKISVSLKRINDKYEFKVKDNGIGLPEGIDLDINKLKNLKSFGLTIITIFSKQLDADISVLRDNGTEFIIIFNA